MKACKSTYGKRTVTIHWMLTHKAMHSLNGNIDDPRASRLDREMKRMQSSFGGRWHQPASRARVAPIIDVSSDGEDEISRPAAKAKLPKQGRKKKQKEEQQDENTNTGDADVAPLWVPNAHQTILIEQMNRRGEHLESDDVEELRQAASQRNVAVLAVSECRFSEAKTQYLMMKGHHCFFAGPTQEQREEQYLKKYHKAALVQLNNALNEEERQAAALKIEQAKEYLKIHREQYWKGGLALYVHQAVFPAAELIEKSQYHILVKTVDLKGQTTYLLAVYGPSAAATENNAFYRETISSIHEKYGMNAILQFGDHNACVDPRADRDIRNAQVKKPSAKVALQELVLAHNLADVRRVLDPRSSVFTYQKVGKDKTPFNANLDYFLANESWMDRHRDKLVAVHIKDVAPEGRDHKPMQLEMRQYSKKVVQQKEKSYKRQLNEEQTKILIERAGQIVGDPENPNVALQGLRECLTVFQSEFLDCDTAPNATGRGKRTNKTSREYEQTRRRVKLVHKAAVLIGNLDSDADLLALNPDRDVEKRDESVEARLLRTLRKLSDSGLPELARPRKDKAEWISDLTRSQKKLANQKRGLLRKMRREKIQNHVRVLVESFADEPRKFYRKIRNMFSKRADGITAIYKSGTKSATSDPNEMKEEVHRFYSDLFRSRGPRNDQFSQWLTARRPTPESCEKTAAAATIEEVKAAVAGLANNKACGEDNLPAELYKVLGECPNFLSIMQNAINGFLVNDKAIPAEWRVSHMILLFKAGDKNDIGNYRPITLVDAVYKIYSTILTKRLTHFLETNAFLHHSQCAFRPDRGTAHKLWAIHAFLAAAKGNRKEAHLVSIDLKKAYDSVEHWIIEDALGPQGLNVPERFRHAIMDTLTDTCIRVRVAGGLTEPIAIGRGVRQGDPLSPLLFNVAIDPLLQRIDRDKTERHDLAGTHAYADDVDLTFFTKEGMERAWGSVLEFLRASYLEANANKTTYARNLRAEQANSIAELAVNGAPLRLLGAIQCFKVLGVEFTAELDWAPQKRLARAKFCGALTSLAKRAVTDVQMIEIVNVMLLSALTYPMAVVPYTKEELQDLEKIMHTTLRRRLRLTDPVGWADWFTLKREEGGFGLYSIKDLHDANHVNGLSMVLNGPDTPAKRAILRECNEESEDANEVVLPDKSHLAHVLQVIKSHGGGLHASHLFCNPNTLMSEMRASQLFRKWIGSLPLREPSNKQLSRLLLVRTARIEVVPVEVLQRNLLRATAIEGTPVPLAHAEKIHKVVSNAVHRLGLQFQPGADALLTIRRDKKTVAEAGNLAGLLDEAPEVYFDPTAPCAWRVKSLQEIDAAVAAIPAEQADEVVLAEDVPEDEKRELMQRVLQNLQKRLATEVKTSDMTEIRATASRSKPIRMLGAEWEVSFTDGSKRRSEDENEDKAGWGIFLPKSHEDVAQTPKCRGKLPGNVIAHRVDGAQTSQRAELAAIYAALSAHKESERNQLVVSDSETSIKLLTRWRNGVPASAVRKCRNRDLLRLILGAEKELKGTVRYVHVYSHQKEAKADRKAKIDAQKAQYGAKDYATMVKGNEVVDKAAGIATKQDTKRRNWATSPMRGVDPMYVTHRESEDGPVLFMDMAPHSWIKEQTQRRIIQEQTDRGKRGKFLALMPLVDKKRSFAAGNSRNCHQHKTYIALAKLRLHATPTAARSSRRAGALDATNPYKKFFQHMYPDKKCFACKQKGVDVDEDTAHMVACPSRDDRRAASVEMWNKVYQMIRDNQGPNALDARLLSPFALRTQEAMALTLHQHGLAGGAHVGVALADVAAFPDNAAALGLIPRKLEAALVELGVAEAAKTADSVAQLVQSAVAADIAARHRAIATGRGQKALFRVHVLGLQPPPNLG